MATLDRKAPRRGFAATKGSGSPRVVSAQLSAISFLSSALRASVIGIFLSPMVWRLSSILILQLAASHPAAAVQAKAPARKPDVVYVPTPPHVVEAMLKAASVTSKDVLYDLGCGDGRIVIEAAKTYGARGVGIDIDPERIEEAEANARKEGVADLIRFRVEDLFEAEIREASVIALYLLPEVNLKLRPKLWKDLTVGARVVSHGYDMGDWKPEQIIWVDEHLIYVWIITDEAKRRSIP